MIKLSIIVPVYNVKPYLERCLRSLERQSEKNIEIILVNDGSTDGSEQICIRHAKEDSRIRFFSKENGGLSSARNLGLEHARGKYVCFVDSDDIVSDDFVSEIVKSTEKYEPDILYFGIEVRNQSMKSIRSWIPPQYKENLESVQDRFVFLYRYFCINWTNHVCDKCYRTDIIKEKRIRFEPNTEVFAEDLCFNLFFFIFVKRIVCLEQILYYYIFRENSIMGLTRDDKEFRLAKMADLMEKVSSYYIYNCPKTAIKKSFPLISGMIYHKLTAEWKKRKLPELAEAAVHKKIFYNNAMWIWKHRKYARQKLGGKMGSYVCLEAYIFLNRNWKGRAVGLLWDFLIYIKRKALGSREF